MPHFAPLHLHTHSHMHTHTHTHFAADIIEINTWASGLGSKDDKMQHIEGFRMLAMLSLSRPLCIEEIKHHFYLSVYLLIYVFVLFSRYLWFWGTNVTVWGGQRNKSRKQTCFLGLRGRLNGTLGCFVDYLAHLPLLDSR